MGRREAGGRTEEQLMTRAGRMKEGATSGDTSIKQLSFNREQEEG